MGTARTLTIPAIDFQFRPQFAVNLGRRLPPPGIPQGGAVLSVNDDGSLVIAGVVLTPYHSNTPGPDTIVQPTYDQGSYGDAQNINATFTGAGLPVDSNGNALQYVLPRPSNQRTQLLIQNNTIGMVFYAFDRIADNTTCIGIAAGGSREFDSRIPQGNLSLFALAGGVAVVEYMNNDVT